MAQWDKDPILSLPCLWSLLSVGSIPGSVQWVKDLALPQLQLGFHLWPRNFHIPWVQQKKKKKKKNKKKKKERKEEKKKSVKNNDSNKYCPMEKEVCERGVTKAIINRTFCWVSNFSG